MAAAADRSLAECAAGERFRVARVIDQSPEFLRFLSQAGLEIGAQGSLVANEPARRQRDDSTGRREPDALARSGGEADGAVAARNQRQMSSAHSGRAAAPLRTTVHELRRLNRPSRSASGEGPLQRGPCEPGQGGNTAAISLRLFVWGPLTGGRTDSMWFVSASPSTR